MSKFWQNWLMAWVTIGVGGFGALLITGAFAATDGALIALLDVLNGDAPIAVTPPLRFALALMGAVTLGWAGTMVATLRAAVQLGPEGGPVWRLFALSLLGWYAIDSTLSVATGFALNAVSNTVLIVAFQWPIWRSGALGDSPPARI